MNECIFCNRETINSEVIPRFQFKYITCPVCGTYQISFQAVNFSIIKNIIDEDKRLFSIMLRENSDRGSPLKVLSETIVNIPKEVQFYRNLSVLDKVNKLVLYVGNKSSYIGALVNIKLEDDYPLFYCKNQKELGTILEYLSKNNTIEALPDLFVPNQIRLTIEGWNKYDSLRQPNKDSKLVFVAMNFDSQYKDIFDNAIFVACKDCDFNAFRVDSDEHNEKICDKIIADIKKSRFIIADFTGQKHGAYFEAGFALGLGLKVIWTCKETEKDNLNFDTRQYNHIFWKNSQDLKEQLVDRIKATIL